MIFLLTAAGCTGLRRLLFFLIFVVCLYDLLNKRVAHNILAGKLAEADILYFFSTFMATSRPETASLGRSF